MSKKTKIAVISVIALVLVTIGITYAYWLVTRTQTGQNVISTGCLDITLSGSGDIELTDQFPRSDEDAEELDPYTFIITNNCTTSVDYQIALEATGTESTAVASSALKVSLNDKITILGDNPSVETTIDSAYESRVLGYKRLAGKSDTTTEDEATYDLKIWIDEDAPISEMSTSEVTKTFKGKITVTIGQGIESPYAEGTLAYSILANNGGVNTVSEIDPTAFSSVTVDNEAHLYKTEDDLGDSYYFRGDVTTNYVKFGTWNEDGVKYFVAGPNVLYDSLETCQAGEYFKLGLTCEEKIVIPKGSNMYWRIVRINGDGSIRLVYDGTSLVANGTAHTASFIPSSYYNNIDPTQVGYTYDVDGVQTDSPIKDAVDAWYESNLKTNYETYIADGIFCNDQSGIRTVTITSDSSDPYENTYYAGYDRLRMNKAPVLTCKNKEDRYTKEDTTNGNRFLTNPVGLLTADEIAMAGAVNQIANKTFYLYSGEYYWTFTPSCYVGLFKNASVWIVGNDGSLNQTSEGNGAGYVNASSNAIRPVINLKKDVSFTGKGTLDSPYEIVTE